MNINEVAGFKGKWLKAVDVKPLGRPQVVINRWSLEDVEQGKAPMLAIHFVLNNQEEALVLNKTNGRMIAHTYGDETDAWLVKLIELRVEAVDFAGKIVDAIRVGVPEAASYQQQQNTTAATVQQAQPQYENQGPSLVGGIQPAPEPAVPPQYQTYDNSTNGPEIDF